MMRITFGTARALLVAGLVTALLVVPGTAWADGTPEGTNITNTATASFTDANNNTYSDVSDQVTVTVGFSAGVDVIAAQASVSPGTSTRDTISFNVANIGNGTDSVTIGETISQAGVITINQYILTDAGGATTTYGTFAAMKAVTDTMDLSANDTIDIAVDYTTEADAGGQSTTYTLDATSQRDGGVSDSDATTINVQESLAVDVTPDGGQSLEHLPSNGTQYTFTFTVQNDGDGPEDFGLKAFAQPGGAISSIVSVNGVGGDTTDISLASGANTTIDVIYEIGDVAAGTQDTLFLRATAASNGAVSDTGFADLTVVRPSLSITKEAYEDAGLTTLVSGDVLPGQTIYYKVTVDNSSGTADAESIQVDDDLPSEVTYVSHGDDGNTNWTITKLDGPPEHIDADLSTLAAGSSAYFWIEVQIN